MSELSSKCAEIVGKSRPGSYKIGFVLGSGLGTVADSVIDGIRIPYEELPGFPISAVSSHKGELVAGKLGNQEIIILSGRVHYYERGDASEMRVPIESLHKLGCEILILTNAGGSLRKEVAPGSIVQITDHINISGKNPLIGHSDENQFVDLINAYNSELRQQFQSVAKKIGLELFEGVYGWWSGPSFETPAEINMGRVIGVDVAGMSTVPEVIIARHIGLRVGAFSIITNFAAGMQAKVSHEETKEMGLKTSGKLVQLIQQFLEDYK